MVDRVGGSRRKTRHKLQKSRRQKGKISISRFFQELEPGVRVCFKAEPAIQGGMYPRRFHGGSGLVKGRRGSCYLVEARDGNKEKTFIVHPVHLRKL
ncbi:50S ribosomal protein L21e [Candidatus Woesearchaeota archaeon]|jgi:large subunit ribosomal protein L21e|nr:50S ribosomal protein L21e [Candidatus Woesearchaeota archaeon]MBT3537753.1 50S ribosomal protein L21e [Candidatus Woesearchaeota archaeon]MBT4697884.1 50S ribosomal protein L21e [Candidatus Woesearchaeota archaeon]MBT4717456.1 50S ribosomal protein L21e [Candidatus Woesearchaeota archaeon]MBT7105422.1 50S ribosomal protein L21e [Candidatus Woesearchaeota archaeon]